MRSTVLAHLMLCCAAVLFLPQALECCRHTGSHTVLEALADGDARASVGPSHGRHQAHADVERLERVTTIASGQDPDDSTEPRPIIKRSLPSGQNTSQPPSLAAINLKSLIALDTGFRLATDPRFEDTIYGQMVRPETPPPRRLV